jgi:hypothetical protein
VLAKTADVGDCAFSALEPSGLVSEHVQAVISSSTHATAFLEIRPAQDGRRDRLREFPDRDPVGKRGQRRCDPGRNRARNPDRLEESTEEIELFDFGKSDQRASARVTRRGFPRLSRRILVGGTGTCFLSRCTIVYCAAERRRPE